MNRQLDLTRRLHVDLARVSSASCRACGLDRRLAA
ncbi:putative leader peptide [Streptomyces longisporoflavus]